MNNDEHGGQVCYWSRRDVQIQCYSAIHSSSCAKYSQRQQSANQSIQKKCGVPFARFFCTLISSIGGDGKKATGDSYLLRKLLMVNENNEYRSCLFLFIVLFHSKKAENTYIIDMRNADTTAPFEPHTHTHAHTHTHTHIHTHTHTRTHTHTYTKTHIHTQLHTIL